MSEVASGSSTCSSPERSEAHFYNFSHDKAGMDKVDKAHVARVVHTMSKGSLFYQNAERRDERLQEQLQSLRQRWDSWTRAQSQSAAHRAMLAAAETSTRGEAVSLESSRDLRRCWAVVDLDQFYCAVEMRDNPSLRDQPMAVGGIGMLSTANYEARKYGVRSAMPGFIARELCPHLIIVPPDFRKYTEASRQCREVFRRFDPHFQSMSLDEAYLDITDRVQAYVDERRAGQAVLPSRDDPPSDAGETDDDVDVVLSASRTGPARFAFTDRPSSSDDRRSLWHQCAWDVVQQLRAEVASASGLTCSAGVAPCVMLAKVASDVNKPNGQCLVPFHRAGLLAFVGALPVRKVPGIGKVTETTLTALGLETMADVRQHAVRLRLVLSPRMAAWLHRCSLGLGEAERSEEPYQRKSISIERTFRAEARLDILCEMIDSLAQRLASQMQGHARIEEDESGADEDAEDHHHEHHAQDHDAEGEEDAPGVRTQRRDSGGTTKELPDTSGVVPGFFGHGLDATEGGEFASFRGKTVTVKVKLNSFQVRQRSITLEHFSNDAAEMSAAAVDLLRREARATVSAGQPFCVRMLGLRMHNLQFDAREPTALERFLQAPVAAEAAPAFASTTDTTVIIHSSSSSSATSSPVRAEKRARADSEAPAVVPLTAASAGGGMVLRAVLERRLHELQARAPSAKRPQPASSGSARVLASFVQRSKPR